jgi:hypothetical protein
VSDSPEGLTNELQRRSSFLATSGGFGDIWKCTLLKANGNIDVAVKTIRAFEMDNEESIQKNARGGRRELKVWGRLKHHSILLLWGVVNDFVLERQQDKLSSLDMFSLVGSFFQVF